MNCPFCNNPQFKLSFYPKNNFNNKEFNYVVCTDCNLTYLKPFPVVDDYEKMYPPSYQESGIMAEMETDWNKKLTGAHFSYAYHFYLIKQLKGDNVTILDYGCGNGHFILNAMKAGFDCVGAEYNSQYVQMLNKRFRCLEIEDFMSSKSESKFDVIRLSNVLEHVSNPNEVILKLCNNLNPNGIFLIEGPIEHNFTLAQTFRNLFFRLRKLLSPNRTVSLPPYHIFFSTAQNQRKLFSSCNLEEKHFNIDEDPWPFPVSFSNAIGLKGKLMAAIAYFSIFFTNSFGKGRWGNMFIYAGKRN